MKKLSELNLSFLFVFGGLLFSSCSAHDDLSYSDNNYLKVSDMEIVGILHNEIMTKVNANISSDEILEKSSNEEEAIDAVAKFIETEFVSIKTNDEIATEPIQKYKNFLQSDRLMNALFMTKARNVYNSEDILNQINNIGNDSIIDIDEIPNINAMISACTAEGILSLKSSYFLNNITNLIQRNYQGTISDAEFERQINKCINEFNTSEYEKNSTEGLALASTLSVAQYSYDWWKENPDAAPLEGKVAPWVVADVGGAAVSGLVYCVKNWNRRVVWSDLASNCLWGAASSSLGLSTKVGKAIIGVFK